MRTVSYKKLFKLLIDRDMKKKDLLEQSGISSSSMSKLSRGETVSLDVLIKICSALNVDIGEVMELVPDTKHEDTAAKPDTKALLPDWLYVP